MLGATCPAQSPGLDTGQQIAWSNNRRDSSRRAQLNYLAVTAQSETALDETRCQSSKQYSSRCHSSKQHSYCCTSSRRNSHLWAQHKVTQLYWAQLKATQQSPSQLKALQLKTTQLSQNRAQNNTALDPHCSKQHSSLFITAKSNTVLGSYITYIATRQMSHSINRQLMIEPA